MTTISLYGDSESHSGSSSTCGEMEEYYKNGLVNTAARTMKENVLQELTSKYDPVNLEPRKPKAAPGKVFRYLQQQYDNEDCSQVPNHSRGTTTSSQSILNGEKTPQFESPSFSFLKNQYNSESSPRASFR